MGDVIGPLSQSPVERQANWDAMLLLKRNAEEMKIEDRERFKELIDKHEEAFVLYLKEYSVNNK